MTDRDDAQDRKLIRNSTAEFLIFTAQGGEASIEARYEDETVWLSQRLMAELFDTTQQNISLHLRTIYDEGELDEASTHKVFLSVRREGSRDVQRRVAHYNLDAIISVGYRVNSVRATQFRQWATRVLRDFALRGYVLDRKRLENGTFLGEDYFERLLEQIREIRLSERRFYQKVTDIYATSVDYNLNAQTTRRFFAEVLSWMHHAVDGRTVTEPSMDRPDGGPFVNDLLDLAESRARRKIPTTMEDWANDLSMNFEAIRSDAAVECRRTQVD